MYLLKSIASIAPLCGATRQDTLVNTLSRVATLIYTSEARRARAPQVHRVQHDQPLLRAVARARPARDAQAVEHLLTSTSCACASAPADGCWRTSAARTCSRRCSAPLRLNGRQIGSIVLSIQDDEGYKRLAGRLAGLRRADVHEPAPIRQLVKNSLGPAPGAVPASGSYRYRGRTLPRVHAARPGVPVGSAADRRADPDPLLVGRRRRRPPGEPKVRHGPRVQAPAFETPGERAGCLSRSRPAARRRRRRISRRPRARSVSVTSS